MSVSGIAATPFIAREICFGRLRQLGFAAGMPDDKPPLHVQFGQLPGPGVKGRPRDSWQTVVQKHLRALKVELKRYKLCQNRQA